MTDQLVLQEAAERHGSTPLSRRPLRLLLVEDNPADARLVEEAFRQPAYPQNSDWQFEIIAVRRQQEAINALRSEEFDLVLLDLGLPASQGLETIREVRAARAHLPIVVLTGNDDQATAMRALRAGAQHYLIKGQFDGELPTRTVCYSLEQSRLAEIIDEQAGANKRILASLSAHIAVVNKEGKILRTNQEWDQFSRENQGKPEATGVGVNYLKVLEQAVGDGAEEAEAALRQIRRVLKGISEFEEMEYPCHSPTGQRWFAMRVTPLKSSTEIGVVISHEDITDQRKAEIQLEQRTQELRTILDHAPDIVVRYDLKGRHLYVSPSIERYTGKPPEFYLGKTDAELVISGSRAKLWRRSIEKVIETGSEYQVEYRDSFQVDNEESAYTFQARLVPEFDAEGNIQSVVVASRDISEREKARKALEASEKRYRSLFNSIRDAILVADQERRIIECNPAFTEIFGYEQEEILGKPTAMLYKNPAEFELLGQKIKELREQGESGKTVTVQYRRKDGEAFPGETSIYSLTVDGGQDVGAIGLIRDVTEQARRHREQQAIAQVAEALRQASLSEEMPPIILEELMDLLSAGGAEMVLTNQKQDRLWVELGVGSWQHTTGIELDIPDNIAWQVLQTDEPFLTNDVHAVEGFANAKSVKVDRAAIGVNMKAGKVPVGVIWVARPYPFTRDEIQLLQSIGDMAANALRRAGLHEETKERAEQMSAVSLLGHELVEKLDEYSIYERLINGTMQLVPGASTMGIWRYDEKRSQLQMVIGRHEGTDLDMGLMEPIQLPAPGFEPVLEAIANHRPVIADDLSSSNTSHFGIFSEGKDKGLAAGLFVPMVSEGKVIGLLQILSFLNGRFSQRDGEIMAMLANTAAVALENATLIKETQGYAIELAMAYDTTLEGWAKALELRDKETEGHTRRVTDLTVKLAARLGLPADQMVHVRRGALMHDIGKMGIPDSILLKPGKLTEEEWEIMRQHPQLAYDMLAPVDFLQPALTIPHYHHERWDGSGYPEGLKGQEIPIEARIFAVIDVYDALSSDRPYRQAWPSEKVYGYLREKAGVEFDPEVVGAFFELI